MLNRNALQEEAENKCKYENLSVEIQPMWSMKCSVISIASLTTGNVTKQIKKIFKNNTRKAFSGFSTENKQV
jgi:hypothetical protein